MSVVPHYSARAAIGWIGIDIQYFIFADFIPVMVPTFPSWGSGPSFLGVRGVLAALRVSKAYSS